MKKYLWNVLVWIDQGVGVLFWPVLDVVFAPAKFGNPDETLSSVFGKYSNECVWCLRVCKVLNFFDENHCEKSIESDESPRGVARKIGTSENDSHL